MISFWRKRQSPPSLLPVQHVRGALMARYRLVGSVLTGLAVFGWAVSAPAGVPAPNSPLAPAKSRSTAVSPVLGKAPPPAVLGEIFRCRGTNGIVVQWRTTLESGALSFDVERLDTLTGRSFRLNFEPVLADNSLAGGTYQLPEPDGDPGSAPTYRLRLTDRRGTEFILATAALPVGPNPAAAVALPGAGQLGGLGGSPPVAPRPAGLTLAALDGTAFLKIGTTNTGVVQVSAATLAGIIGQPVAVIQGALGAGRLQLSNRGQPVPYFVAADSNSFSFYAPAYKDNYTTTNVFWLTTGTNASSGRLEGGHPAATTNVLTYGAVTNLENDLQPVSSLPLGAEDDFWMWSRLTAGINIFNTGTYSFNLDHVGSNSPVPVVLTLRLWGGVVQSHQVQAQLNGQIVGLTNFAGIAPFEVAFSAPGSALSNGVNRLVLKALPVGVNSPLSQWYLNSFSLSYPRTYVANSGMVEFGAAGNALITVAGFTGPAITLLEISNPLAPAVVTNLTIEAVSPGYRCSFIPGSPTARYVAFQSGAGLAPAAVTLGLTAGLGNRTNAADYVIITPDAFLGAATNLSGYRQSTGLHPLIARLESIYNEFAYGFVTPHALNALLAAGTTNWVTAPRYAVLLGDGTYDYRNLLGFGDNLNPPLLVSTPYGLFSTDSQLGDINGDGLPEVAVGRLSGHTLDEINRLVSRIQNYEAQSLPVPAQALLLADIPDPAGDFNADMQSVANSLAGKFVTSVIRRTDLSDDAAMTQALTNQLAAGVDFLNYSGHGAVDRFGSAGYLTSALATNLHNPRLPLVVAITCVAGQFAVPGNDCLGEMLGKAPQGGAIAVIAPTGLSWNTEAIQLNVRLTQLLQPNTLPRLGDNFVSAMADHIRFDYPGMPSWIYNLLGDPGLRYNVLSDLRVTAASSGGEGILLQWPAVRSAYQVEWQAALNAPWQSLGVTSGGSFRVTNSFPQGFFRVRPVN